MNLAVLELPTENFAYSLIVKMIEQSPDERPPITDICEALAVIISIVRCKHLS
jgi:hypothetical protein